MASVSAPVLRNAPAQGQEPDRTGFVELSGVSLRLGSEKILDDVSFTVQRGEFCCILGPSGCGKSTSLRLLGNLLQPDAGEIRIGGRSPREARAQLAFVFQSPRLVPWRNALNNVLLGTDLRFGRRSRREFRDKALHYLDLVGLRDAARKYPFMLSGGERQRIAIARALTVDPDIILMDEPFAALDIETRRRMQDEIFQIWSSTGKTIIFVTHDVREAIALADRIIMLSHKPTRVTAQIALETPRPRLIETDRALQKLRASLNRHFHRENAQPDD